MTIKHFILPVLFALVLFSCKKDPLPPSIVVSPGDFQLQVESELIEFSLKCSAGDANLNSLTITTKPNGGITTTLLDTLISGRKNDFLYVLYLEPGIENQVVVFTVKDVDGYQGQTARRILNEGNVLLEETSGYTMYSPYSGNNSDAFDLSELEPLFLNTLSDSSGVDLTELDLTDDDMQSGNLTSLSGIKFVRNNSFNYAAATEASAKNTYNSSVPLQTISNIQIDDILITKYDTMEVKHAVIKITAIQDLAGSENDRITFNVKK